MTTFLEELYAVGTLTDDHDTEYDGGHYITPSILRDNEKDPNMTKTPCPDCDGDGATYEQVRVGQHATPFVCFRRDGDGEVTDPNIPIEEVEVRALREALAREIARANALQDELDKEREEAAPTPDALASRIEDALIEALGAIEEVGFTSVTISDKFVNPGDLSAAVLPIVAAEVRKAKAEALREAADGIDLDGIAEEWSPGPGNRDDMHWAAGNAASSVVIALHDRATEYEREPGSGAVR